MKKVLKQLKVSKLILMLSLALILSHLIFLHPQAIETSKPDVQTKTEDQAKTDVQTKTDIKLMIDEKAMNENYDILLQNDRLMVPMRVVAENLGADITWIAEERSVIMQTQGRKITLFIDKVEADIDGKTVKLDVKPFLHHDRTMVPIRFLAEQLNCFVRWDDATRTAHIDKTPSDKNKVDFEVIADLSNYLFLDKYVKDHSTYALGHHFVKDGYSYVIISYGQQRTGGYQVKVDGVYFLEQQYDDQKYFVVKSHLQAPAPDAIVTMALTYPYAIIRFENKDSLDVRVEFDSDVNLGELQ